MSTSAAWEAGYSHGRKDLLRDREALFLAAIEQGLIRREWSCGSDKSECSPEDTDRGYLHAGCHWHYFLWTVEQDKIEELYQKAKG